MSDMFRGKKSGEPNDGGLLWSSQENCRLLIDLPGFSMNKRVFIVHLFRARSLYIRYTVGAPSLGEYNGCAPTSVLNPVLVLQIEDDETPE